MLPASSANVGCIMIPYSAVFVDGGIVTARCAWAIISPAVKLWYAMAITGLHPLLVVEASSGFGAIPRLRKTALREFPCVALQSHVDLNFFHLTC